MFDFWESFIVNSVATILRVLLSDPKKAAKFVPVIQHINTDSGALLAALQAPLTPPAQLVGKA